MRIEVLIKAFKDEQSNAAHDLMQSPAADIHALGRAQGYYAGLEKAIEIITGVHDDTARRDARL